MMNSSDSRFVEDVQLAPLNVAQSPVIRYQVFDVDPTVEAKPRLSTPAIYMRIGDSPWVCAKTVVSGIEATAKRHLNG